MVRPRRALRNWPDLADRMDADAYREALERLDGRLVPCLPRSITPRSRRERRALARWLMARGQREGSVLRLP
jgi:hypothetical protein